LKNHLKAFALLLVGLAILLPFASSYPDGLETVAETLGVEETPPVWEGLMPDYTIPAVGNLYLSTLFAGVFGAFALLLVGLAILLPFASSYPDGLETVAETLGVEKTPPVWEGLMPDYTIPAVGNLYLSTLFAGVFGAFLVFVLTFILGKTVSKSD